MVKLMGSILSQLGIFCAAVILFASVAFASPVRQLPEGVPIISFKQDLLMLTTALGDFPIDIELAEYSDQHQRGLMFVQSMGQDDGMLFIFDREQPRAFWMRNTPLSLDIIYIDKDGFVVSWAPNTTPFSLQSLPSGEPAQYVLELNAGSIEHFGIEVGDQITYPVN